MTCIVGVVDGDRVWIGGDSHAAAGCQRYPVTDIEPKVFRRGEMVIGVTGPARMTQLLMHVLEIPEHPDDVETYPYLVTRLMPAVRAMVVEHDGVHINNNQDGWEFLLAYRGALYVICHDLSVSHLPEYGAVGCGREYATGSLHATSDGEWDGQRAFEGEARVRMALRAAAAHDVHVASPFIVEAVG